MDNKVQESLKDEIMTLNQVAAYLKVAEKTVLRMAHKGEIPCAKVASQWRFVKPMIDNWLLSKMKYFNPDNELGRILVEDERALIPVTRLLHHAFVICDLKPGSIEQVLRQLVEPLFEAGIVADKKEYLHKLVLREQLLTTALGKGIAVPHIRNPRENPRGVTLIIVGICKEGTDFGSLDNEPTRLFLLLCTDSEKLHLRILAQLNRIINDDALIQELLKAPDEQTVIELFANKEKALFQIQG
ncbi:MAG: PTS sugar transporter subunit IIA [Spirochaetales bacterium]|nr:PTS sugar transporter subunit IIA [Spirochaetales bacterium]